MSDAQGKRKRPLRGGAAFRKFDSADHRRSAVLERIWGGPQCISCVQVIGEELRGQGYGVEDWQVAVDVGWWEARGAVEVVETDFAERHMIRLLTPGFDLLRPHDTKRAPVRP